ncbi:MAG: metallophosphatase domain-containing protein, partial [archaeon]|nr:metallophosphatase domain-containing protein [archaeon]
MGNSRSKRQPEEGGEEGGAAAAAAAGPSVSEEEVKEGLLEFLRARVCPREDDKWEWEAVWSGEGEAAGMDSKVMPHDVKRAVALFGEVLGRKRAGEDVSADEDKLLLGLSEEPDVAFYFLRELLVIRDVPLPLPLRDETVGVARVVCISDTHSKHCSLQLPKGDFLIHAGDFSNVGKPNEVAEFLQWFGEQAFRHKVMIAGNHDLILDPAHYKTSGHRFHRGQQFHPEEVLPLLQSDRFVYLQDRHVVLDGVSIYGTPWQPEFCDWAFNVIRGSPIRPYWQQIPDQVDIL